MRLKKKPDFTNLATALAVTAVENKVFNMSNLVRKTDCNTKISEIEVLILQNLLR